MPRPRELSDLVTRRPEAVVPEHSKSTTKGLRVTKSLGYGIYNLHKQQSYGNTLKHQYERGRAINRFSERRDFEIFMKPI